ncbi:hypothetical protein [Sandaracinobacter sp.]|uniref:hypothetical protein n=1 Tax=Sandaracinobacter sp. TaxID=2487581 RepID=UPI0035B36383
MAAPAAFRSKVGWIKMPDIQKARFLRDEASQILALRDALCTAHGPAISAAFDMVARTRGLAQIARDSNMDPDDLLRAFADPVRPDTALLQEVVSALMRAQGRHARAAARAQTAVHAVVSDGRRGGD